MIENWVYSLFFCAGELWGGVVISVLFWSLANEVCSVTEAKTIYPLMGISANIALVVAGNYMKWVNRTLTQVLQYCPGSMRLSSSVTMPPHLADAGHCSTESSQKFCEGKGSAVVRQLAMFNALPTCIKDLLLILQAVLLLPYFLL